MKVSFSLSRRFASSCLLAFLLVDSCFVRSSSVFPTMQRQQRQEPELLQAYRSLAKTIDDTLDCDPCIDRRLTRLVAVLPAEAAGSVIPLAMQQAASDMNVDLRLVIAEDNSRNNDMAALLRREMVAQPNNSVDAWIVHVADDRTEAAIQELQQQTNSDGQLPIVFGWGWGYQSTVAVGAAGWMASDDAQGGRLAAQELVAALTLANGTKNITQVTFVVTSQSQGIFTSNPSYVRQEAFREELQSLVGATAESNFQTVTVVSDNGGGLFSLTPLFQGCPQQAILLDNPSVIEEALQLKEQYACKTLIALFLDDYSTELNPQVYRAITRGQISFALNPQIHLQSSLSVVLAAVYATTGKKPSMPIEVPTYWTGPKLVNKRNVPSDTSAACEKSAFPICTIDDNNYGYNKIKMDESTEPSSTCPCAQRRDIRIGGVFHGATTDAFWDPIFASAEQAALDMNIELDLERFQSQDDFAIIVDQMAARIRNLCDSGVDGIFVSIPSPIVVEAVQRCLDLAVPVVSVNSGVAESKALGLIHHIGQNEYAGGYGAAQQMIQAGMKRGYCVDHEFGNSGLAERCQGFKDAIVASSEEVEFIEHFGVPRDNEEQFMITVKEKVAEDGNWEGVGLLQLAAASFPALRKVLDQHPSAVCGVFDLTDAIFDAIGDNVLLFTVDQQPFLQGNLPVYLLTYFAYTQQTMDNHLIQSGPSFVKETPSDALKVCEANNFNVCPDRPNENLSYISSRLLAFGYALFGTIVFVGVAFFAWTYTNREKWVVKVSQPLFLWVVILGAFISSLSIVFMGFQTTYRLDQDKSGEFKDTANPDIAIVDASCMAVPWLYGMGFVLVFSALFAKIHRVKLIYHAGLQMQRKQVNLSDVMPIVAVMLTIELGILLAWQIIAPLRWEREVKEELDGYATISVGSCEAGTKGWAFFLALLVFHVLCLLYALVLCFQTKDINSDFAESSYVSLAVAFMFQVLVLAAPISALVRDNTDVFYFIRATTVFLQNFTVLVLIFVPKIARMREEDKNPSTRSTRSASSKRIDQRSARSENFSGKKDSWAGAQLSDFDQPLPFAPGGAMSSDLDVIQEDEQPIRTSAKMSDRRKGRVVQFRSSDSVPDKQGTEMSNGSFLLANEILSHWEELGFVSGDFARTVFTLLSRSTDPETRRSLSRDVVADLANDALSNKVDPESLLAPAEVLSNWEDLGFVSKDIAEQTVNLLKRSTSHTDRQIITSQLYPKISEKEEDSSAKSPIEQAPDMAMSSRRRTFPKYPESLHFM